MRTPSTVPRPLWAAALVAVFVAGIPSAGAAAPVNLFPTTRVRTVVSGRREVLEVLTTELTQQQRSALRDPTDYMVEPSRIIDQPFTEATWLYAIALCNRASVLLGLEPAYRMTTADAVSGDLPFEVTPVEQIQKVIFDPKSRGLRLMTTEEWAALSRQCVRGPYQTAVQLPSVAFAGLVLPPRSFAKDRCGLYELFGNSPEWLWDSAWLPGPDGRVVIAGAGDKPCGGPKFSPPHALRTPEDAVEHLGADVHCGLRMVRARASTTVEHRGEKGL